MHSPHWVHKPAAPPPAGSPSLGSGALLEQLWRGPIHFQLCGRGPSSYQCLAVGSHRRMAMPSLVRHFWPCIEMVCESVNNREKISYGELADKLRLKLARQEWSALLDLVA